MSVRRPPLSTRARVGYALLSLLLALVVLEGAARVGGSRWLPRHRSLDALPGQPLDGEPNMVGDAATGWRARVGPQQSFGIPGGTTVNSRGLRGPEIPLEKPAGTRRVLLLGDSTVFGVLVRDEETFARVAETRLREVDPHIEVLNGGTPGYSSLQARRALEARLAAYAPDVLVVATLWSDAQGAEKTDAVRFGRPTVRALEASFAYLILREWVREIRWGSAPEEVRVDLSQPPRGRPGPATERVPLPEYRENLAALAGRAEALGADVAWLVLPSVRDPSGGRVGDFRDGYRDAMREAARQHGGTLVDTPARFAGGNPQALFHDDVHPTAQGHTIVGEALAAALEDWARAGTGAAGERPTR